MLRRLELAEALHPLWLVDERDRFALDPAIGLAHGTMQLEIERGEADRRHRGHLPHHDGQQLAHGDRRFDVDATAGGKGCDQLELLAHRIESVADQRHLGIDHAGGTVDEQPFRGAGRAGQHDDVGDAGNQR